MFLRLMYYGAILFVVALGISFAIRMIRTGIDACFNGSPLGLLYILAVYLVLYLLAKFVINRRFNKSSLVVVGMGTCNMCYGFIGLGISYGINPVVFVAIEAAVVAIFILIGRTSGDTPLTWVRGEFPRYVLADAILDDCVIFKSGRRGFQVMQFAEVRGSGTVGSVLLSAWKAMTNLSFEIYRRGDELLTLISVWETSRDFDEAVGRAREKMSIFRAILEKEGYETRLISDELEIERYLYSPLLAQDGNFVGELNKEYLDNLNFNELGLNEEAKPILERVKDGEVLGVESVGYVLLLQPVLNIDKEFRKAEKELKHKIERLASNKFKKNDPAALIAMLSLTQDKSLILQPGLEKEITEARVKCQRMIDAKSSGLWGASLFLVGKGGDVTRIIGQVNTEKGGECVYNLIRRRKYSEKYNSEEVSELLPIRLVNSVQEPSCEEDVQV
ncbi:MAG: hypothetical protein ACUVXA_00165 [Candidatus Jordarchaeum sp.]|uniref:hypothetical protein n=1 Tax=Candidatus Jordarchaeum sp. TaxID=2823881 RepID=UPI0040497008